MFKGSKKAFTLAEVLITLGIIGVVAAMTMPTLMNSTQGAQYRTAFKKGMSVLSQAATLNFALDDYDFSTANPDGTSNYLATGDADQTLYRIFRNRMNIVKTTTSYKKNGKDLLDTSNGNYVSNPMVLYFNDGMVFIFNYRASKCEKGTTWQGHRACMGVIDVNGEKGPNMSDLNSLVTSSENCAADGTATTPDDFSTVTCTKLRKHVPDQYHVVFYDQAIVPATAAGRYVMYGK